MLIQLAQKYRIYPTPAQEKSLGIQFGHARFVYNHALNERIEYYKANGKGLSCFSTIKGLVPLKIENDWLQEADSQVLQQKLRDLDTAYKNFFRKTARFPRFKKKTDKQSIRYPQRVRFVDSKIYLPKVGWVKTVFHRPLRGIQKSTTVSKTKSGKYFVSVLCAFDIDVPVNTNSPVGIDLGLKDFAILSNGERIAHPSFFRKAEKRLSRTQRRLSKKRKGSNNRDRARVRLARAHERVANQRADFLHKLSRYIVTEFGFVGFENLNVKGMVKNRSLAKSISDSGWSEFVRMCEYKARQTGIHIHKIDRFFPSSKTCSHCGHIHHDLKLSDREWICPSCKEKLDRDVNAAINILINATGGTPGIHACGDCVRPAGFSGGLRSLKQEATDFSRLVAHLIIIFHPPVRPFAYAGAFYRPTREC